MTYRDILVQIDEHPAARVRSKIAARLAADHGARLTGVFLGSEFIQQFMAADSLSFLSPDAIDKVLSEHAEAVEAAADKAEAAFRHDCGELGVEPGFITVSGDSHDPIVGLARRADLTVFPSKATACLGANTISAAQLGLAAGAPILVAPDHDPFPFGQRVLIAWNGSREAGRAVRDALPLLEAAQEVHVLTVSADAERHVDAGLERYLQWRGLKPIMSVDDRRDESAAEVITAAIKEDRIDLLVMGLYGRPRLEELVLGGVSREFLSRPPVPILVSH